MANTGLGDVIFMGIMGKIFTFLWMSFPIPESLEKSRLGKLHTCELCAGTWIYSILFALFGVDMLPLLGIQSLGYIGGLMTGGVISFIVFLISVGFREQYMSFYIE